MTFHDFTWTPRSTLPLAASVVVGSWAVLAALAAAIAYLLGGEALAAWAANAAGTLAVVVAGLLLVAAFLGCVLERPEHIRGHRSRSAVPVSRPVS